MNLDIFAYWHLPIDQVFKKLESSFQGLSAKEVNHRHKQYGPNLLNHRKPSHFALFFKQFKSPLILLFLFTALLSTFLSQHIDATIIFLIVGLSSLLGFWQERKAVNITEKLHSLVQVKTLVFRENEWKKISRQNLVPGDILELKAGDIIPADCLIFECKNLIVDEATLTGESFGVEKSSKPLLVNTPLNQRTNTLYMGCHVMSGRAKAIVIHIGTSTEFGKIFEHLRAQSPKTAFEISVKKLSLFLMKVTLTLVVFIFIFNLFFDRPILTSLLFTLALAIGLAPQLLPAIISVNLAHGAEWMARKKVIVKKMNSIENFGSMNILCADKTGTLTEGHIKIHSIIDLEGQENEKLNLYAYLNSFFQSGYHNLIDEAILNQFQFETKNFEKIDEIPYDFVRKRLTICVKENSHEYLITKGALKQILSICSHAEIDHKEEALKTHEEKILKQFEEYSRKGFRVLGIAYQKMTANGKKNKHCYEEKMVFLGFILLFDPIKKGVIEIVKELSDLGISLKIFTGDNQFAARHVAEHLGIDPSKILTGEELAKVPFENLTQIATEKAIFADLEPNQKELLITYLRKDPSFVVGYLGDGINDASALKAADIGISVDHAADLAKEAADIVLLEKKLEVLKDGVLEGRRTFGNTLKYIFMAISANFGNMFSMAGASLFLPFLPLLPKQILLNNFLTDIPEMTISTDSVDPEMSGKPERFSIRFTATFMLVFGLISSIFDFLTFGSLFHFFHAKEVEFRTGWFVESVLSASIIILVVRTRRFFLKSKPSPYLLFSILSIVLLTIYLPFSPLAKTFGLMPLPLSFYGLIGGLIILYITFVEIAKKIFYKKAHLMIGFPHRNLGKNHKNPS